MSEDSIDIEGEIDGGWDSYFDPSKHGPMHQNNNSETVDVIESNGGENSGEVSTDFIPNEVENAEELSDTKQEILKRAGSNPNQTAARIDEKVGTSQYANKVLSQECPEWYENVFKTKGKSKHTARPTQTDQQSDNGGGESDTRDENSSVEDGISTHTVEFEQAHQPIEEPDSTSKPFPNTTNEDNEESPFTTGDKAALQSLFGTDREEVKAGIEAMKAVAVHQETLDALEWIEQYL